MGPNRLANSDERWRSSTGDDRTRSVGSSLRSFPLLALLAALGLLASSCTSVISTTDEMTSAPRPPQERRSYTFDPGGGSGDQLAPGGEIDPSMPGFSEDFGDLGDLGDFGDLGDRLDEITGGLGELDGCLTLTLAFVQLPFIAFTANGDAGQAQIDTIMDELRAKIPADLEDELQIVGDVYAEAASGGILNATGAMSDPEFTDANEAIGAWLQTKCTDDGVGGVGVPG